MIFQFKKLTKFNSNKTFRIVNLFKTSENKIGMTKIRIKHLGSDGNV